MRIFISILMFYLAGASLLHSAASPLPVQRVNLATGIRMAFVETGNTNGPKVLLLHGYTDTKRSFYPTIAELRTLRPDLHIFALDARGHGDSSMPDPKRCAATPERCFRFQDFVSDVLAFMDAKKIDKAYLAGHSMGSMIAQELALTEPKRLLRMVLIATGPSARKNAAVNNFLIPTIEGTWKEALVKKGYEYPKDVYTLNIAEADPAAHEWLKQNWVTEPLADPEFLAAVLPETNKTSLGTWIGALRNIKGFDTVERMKDLKVDTLVIWATQDNVFTREDQELLGSSLAVSAKRNGIRYFRKQYGKKPLPESGIPEHEIAHNTQWGAPKAVAADLASFFQSNGEPVRTLPYAARSDDGSWTVAFEKQP